VAHQPDEFVEREQLAQCLGFLTTLTTRLERRELALAA
jgi:acetylornithine deacetylase/succinyl-diaminopimelate desuccinylase-like protein